MSNPVPRKAVAPVNKEEEEERLRSELFGGVKPKSPVVPPVAPPPPPETVRFLSCITNFRKTSKKKMKKTNLVSNCSEQKNNVLK